MGTSPPRKTAAPQPRKPLPPRSQSSKNKPNVKARKPSAAGQIIGFIALGLLTGAGVFIGTSLHNNPGLQKYIPSIVGGIVHPKTVEDVFPGQKTLNLMVIGRDYDYSDSDQIIKTKARSDMLMMARIDFDSKKISFLSIPRDTRADIPGFGVGKINGAHAHGGPALTEQTVQSNFGIPSEKYVAIDFQGFEEAIDQLGGVDLNVDKKMDYDDNWGHLHIHLKPGEQHLNGQQAMGFVRFRHSDSDLVRVQRQQALLAALKAKLLNPATLAAIPNLLGTMDRHLDSDMTPEQKIAIANFVHETPRDQIQMATLPSTEGKVFVETDWEKARPMIQQTFGVAPPEAVAESAPRHRRRRHRTTRVADAQ
ncbi:MAG: LCP family protein [Capsulimonas sp.]|uniref:LCP family protein n=1 Tax=Capsulimonas sp. TaxID=2494211 RepID=UPI003264D0C9